MNGELLKLGFYYTIIYLYMFEIFYNDKLKRIHIGKREKISDILKSKPTTLEFSL